VGIIGFPNAGKSTLIRAFTSARPKIGNYPFTTLTPNLGVAQTSYGEPFVVADIPGLIEGAHTGTGLGIQFLKHIERTRILIHLIDTSTIDVDKPLKGYQAINKELKAFNKSLVEKPQIIVLNKLDLSGTKKNAEIFKQALKNEKIECISAATGEGVDRLIGRIETALGEINEE
jgi:GTP-binding protein